MNVNENKRTNVNEPTNVNENERTNVNENKVNEREREHCRTNVNESTNVNMKCNYRQMADCDEEQILYDSIAEGSSQYWNEEEGNEDPNQYLNEEGNVESDAEGNQEGHVERDVEGNQEEEASGSQPSVGQKRARGQRGAAKKLEGRHIITEVEEDGRPSAPAEAAKNYIRHSGWVVRDNVPVSTVYWRRTKAHGDHESFVPDSEKEMLWTTMLETFTLPAGTEDKSFKGKLYKKYILKGQTPNFDTFPKLRDHWDEFVAYKTGEQGQAMMERNKENAAKKKYHHHLGSGGYSVAMPKWEEMEASLLERGIEPATANWPERSKFWYYAHGGTLNPADGSLVLGDQIREAARRLTDAVEASSQGTFRPDRERDELSLALQTPEHPGRTRGKGVIPWKIGFKEDIHTYRSRMRSKRDTEAKIADLEFRVSSYELSMQEEVARKVDERKATHLSNDLQPTIPPAMVASGMAIPTDPSGTYHCRPIPAGYSTVEVELVEGVYEDLELDYPGGDAPSPPHAPAPTPPQAPAPTPPRAPTLTPPQAPLPAPSKSRAPQAPPPAHTRATKKAKVDAAKNKDPGYDCTQEELDAYVASEVKRQFKPRSPEKKIPIDPSVMNFFRGMSAPAKEAIKLSDYERTLKKASFGKSKPVPQLGEQPNQEIEPLVTGKEMTIEEFITDTGLTTDQLLGVAPIEKAEVKYMYELGKPLVKPELLQSLPTQMYKFHQLYMEMSATGREMIGARIRDTDFLQGDDILWINFKGIYELYQLDALDVSIMSCWILMEIQRARRWGVFDTGFIDPRKVNVAMLDQYPQATEDNLVHLLKAQHYKTIILLPYNTEFHWVLLLFDLSAYTINVYDSMDKKESTFDKVFELIDRAWYRFRHLVRGKWRERLRRKFKFLCAKQKKGTNLCGYYVCEYCHCLADQIITTRELNFIRMRDNLTTHKEFIAAVQEQLMGFINEQILDLKGEFYYDGNTIHRSLASELATTTTSKS
uniref:OSJNBb0072M01.13 protein n=1 Tax=Oryza sativa subsp. japonica TaxID=39947 RepID=Q7XU92_ORYSJ|nr:OSJNBb0072M01.13 [Oryza sativa Japonica Group]